MARKRRYWVYIIANHNRTIYIGVTGNICKRIQVHREGSVKGFASRYGLTILVYYEGFDDVHAAIRREKQLKGWRRSKKISLIESRNPGWLDLWPELHA